MTMAAAESTAMLIDKKSGCPDPDVHSPLGVGPKMALGDFCYDPSKHDKKEKEEQKKSVAPFGFVPAGKSSSRTADDWAIECALRLEDALFSKF